MINLNFKNLELHERYSVLTNLMMNFDDKRYVLYYNNKMHVISFYSLIKWLDEKIVESEIEPEFYVEQLFKEHLLFRQNDFLSESSSEE